MRLPHHARAIQRMRRSGRRNGGFIESLILFAILTVIKEFLLPPPEVENAKPSGLGDFSFPTATQGRVIPLIWGTVKLAGPNVIWYGDLQQVPIVKEIKTGLFSSIDQITGYKYRIGWQMALCRGPIDELLGVYIGDDFVADYSGAPITDGNTFTINLPELFGGDSLGSGGIIGTWKLFGGTTSQSASDYLSNTSVESATIAAAGTGYLLNEIITEDGSGTGTRATFRVAGVAFGTGAVTDIVPISGGSYTANSANPAATTGGSGSGLTLNLTYGPEFQAGFGSVPAYRGTAYVVNNATNAYIGNSTSIKPWAFLARRIPNGLGLLTSQAELNSGNDANPANVIYEILTDTDWGLSVPTADIDTSNFNAVAATLATEGNGFSYILDRASKAEDLLRLVQEQIDGIIYYDGNLGQWRIGLARADYTPGTQPLVDESSAKLLNYSRGSWENTANEVRVEFADRANEFQTTYGVAQDTANVRIQGSTVSVTKRYPGVKSATLANDIAWRDLRTFAYPLAKATVEVDREFWDVAPADVVELSNSTLGVTRLPMRVTKIDFGTLDANTIRLELVQDVFYSSDPSFGDPTGSSWTDPTVGVEAFPADEQVAFEAPRALVRRDPRDGSLVDKVYAAARQRGAAAIFEIRERHSAGAVSGDFSVAGTSFQFCKIGVLNAALTSKSAYPLTSLDLFPAPDAQDVLTPSIATTDDLGELGTNLLNLVLVGDEFMLVESASNSASLTRLNNVYRGALDSVQADHDAGTPVYVLSSGGAISDDSIPETDNVEVKLIPVSINAELAEASATTISFAMDKRIRRPYPPSLIELNGSAWDTTNVSLEFGGSGPEDYHVDVDLRRRDYRTADLGDEITALGEDAATTFGDFPTANSTDHLVTVTHDPGGADDAVYTAEVVSGSNFALERLVLLQALDGAVPTGDLRVAVQSRHSDGGETLTSRQTLAHDFDIASALEGQVEFGLLSQNETSATYTADAAGQHDFTLSSTFTAGDVEYRIDTGGGFGAWTTLIAAGNTTGNIAGVSVSDDIQVRHTSADASILKQLDMAAPGAGTDAFAVLEN